MNRAGDMDAKLLATLQERFEKNMNRHQGLEWSKVRVRLESDPEKLRTLQEMEGTGGEPETAAIDMATAMGIELLDEAQYRQLQELGTFDARTSSWILTPAGIRKLGGALFADYRYGHVFVYHNGAESYYAARGFRGWVKV